MKDKHNDDDDDDDDNEPSFYCSECGVLKATKKQLQNHEIYNLCSTQENSARSDFVITNKMFSGATNRRFGEQ